MEQPCAAFTIAEMPVRMGSDNVGHASTISCKSASAGIGGKTATDAFTAPVDGALSISAEFLDF